MCSRGDCTISHKAGKILTAKVAKDSQRKAYSETDVTRAGIGYVAVTIPLCF